MSKRGLQISQNNAYLLEGKKNSKRPMHDFLPYIDERIYLLVILTK
jgi:hypothetical protein